MSVIIGMDPHKRSATIEVIDEQARVLAAGRYGTDKAGYAQMLAAGQKFAGRVWAIEGCNGVGRHIAHRLVASGETVKDVPAKLSAQVRVFGTGQWPQDRPGGCALGRAGGVTVPSPGHRRGQPGPGGAGPARRPA